jgi:hypothetical protein
MDLSEKAQSIITLVAVYKETKHKERKGEISL